MYKVLIYAIFKAFKHMCSISAFGILDSMIPRKTMEPKQQCPEGQSLIILNILDPFLVPILVEAEGRPRSELNVLRIRMAHKFKGIEMPSQERLTLRDLL